MPKTKEPVNLFYVLVVVFGIAFVITACAYATMAYRAIKPQAQEQQNERFMSLVDRHGVELMSTELTLLGAATFGAMWLDRLRSTRREQQGEGHTVEDDTCEAENDWRHPA